MQRDMQPDSREERVGGWGDERIGEDGGRGEGGGRMYR